ncbi:MerR family DNA-binding transcriptional regulator [Amylibacter sp.]|jgi:DNA-binding transcriptional MerR regulator|nr:MerR family DNA-binding transcriptional regulator [Amylibacter sp.]MDA9329257.1 MerR family DNA-binding transcriptional regulator [bacterium]MDA9073757.1 MerR family DNA-binding transcriptional regulator [Amylibacter sp.]MDA9242467.1 MerR family DNA-binding transcriptional regulator [Amylibacter sp.]MDA9293537.1 MerR family DNA-binding transcriptional regulator [Amylibacter sp.]|tara:strand:- start:10964 stop:11350 length:387 start_codon:yes stop_codon:yes gene_type:complete
MSEEKLTLKEMCEAFEVTPRTLRYYEYIELLIPEKIGKKRLYGNKEKALLTLIKRGRRFGFSLEEIRQWLAMYNRDNQNQTQIEAWINMANNQTIELEERKSEIQKAIDDIKNLRVDAERELRALLKK